jgi:hypothetical protein
MDKEIIDKLNKCSITKQLNKCSITKQTKQPIEKIYLVNGVSYDNIHDFANAIRKIDKKI